MDGYTKNELNYKKKIFIITFIISLIIFIMTPIAGDDWGNFLVGKQGLTVIINSSINMYKVWEGRFISRILIYILTYYKTLWNLLNASLITLLLSNIYKFLHKPQNKYIYLIPIIGIVLINVNFSSQSYLWLAGNITYFIPAIISLTVFTYIYQKDGKLNNKYISLILIITSSIIPMFVENIGCSYIFGILLILIYYWKKKQKASPTLLLMLIISTISLTIMLISPGSQIRMDMNPDFSNLSIIEKIFRNIPNFIKYTFNKNIFLIMLMLFSINKYLINYLKNNKYKYLIIIIFNIIPILTIIENITNLIPLGLNNYNYGIFDTSNWYYIFYWIIFEFIYLLTINKFIKNKKDKEYMIILLLISLSSMGVMLVTPTWGERVTTIYIFLNILINTRILQEFKISENHFRILKIILILIVSLHFGCALVNKIFDTRRTYEIKEQLKNNSSEIIIYYHGITTLWNYTPFEEYHINTFKKYHHIDNDKKIVVKFLSKKQYLKYIITGKINKEEL